MDFYSSIAISITGGALAWIYGLVLIIVVLYTIIALRKQAKNAEDRNKRNPAQNKKLKKK